MSKKLLSIVIPAYRESQNISMIYKSIMKILKERLSDLDYEFIFVNDGSPDNTWEAIQALAFQDTNVK
jgi:glycosyltransferase involved in cell wall biosynthesis